MKRRVIIAVFLAAVVMGCGLGDQSKQQYRTSAAVKEDLIQAVKATGTVTPVLTVEVGSQITGQIKKLFVDFNSPVTAAQVIAQIDDTPYLARVAQDEAAVSRARADLEQVRVKLRQAEKELKRDRRLAAGDIISDSALDTSRASRDALVAQEKLAEASLEQAEATLENSRTQLSYTTIRSPVDGVVISRNVDEGQTVTANLSVQTIFIIASDLTRVHVEGNIPEADIGQIRPGQPVRFSVDAYPDEEFTGAVKEVRLSAIITSNVVTYPIIIEADNKDKKLFPGMTANIYVEIDRRNQALVVPNAALRFKPPSDNKAGANNQPAETGDRPSLQVWIMAGTNLVPVKVATGISDGYKTEIVSGDLSAGQQVVVGIETEPDKDNTASNPFMPKFDRNQRKVTRVR